MNNCIVCGAEFEAKPHLKSRQLCCNNKECQKTHKKQIAHDYFIRHKEEVRKKNRAYRKAHNMYTRCRICGEVIERTGNEKTITHDECIINECAKFFKADKDLPKTWKRKLYNRGLSMTQAREATGKLRKCKCCGKSLINNQIKYCGALCRFKCEGK